MSKTWDELRNEYRKVCEMSCIPANIKKVPLGYIFDEDKSVKWNIEQVEINNRNYYLEVMKLKSERSDCMNVLLEDIYTAIQEDMSCEISIEQAKIIWGYVYDMGHSGGVYDIFSHLYDLMNFVESLLTNK